jgi:hypothetical protein
MMPEQGPAPRNQRNTVSGTGNIITGGTFTGTEVSATTVNAPQKPPIQQLQDELTRMRECLAGVQALTDDHENAMEAVAELQDELATDPDPDPGGLRRLRVRVRQVMGVLTPVAGIIGGVAALEEICQRL